MGNLIAQYAMYLVFLFSPLKCFVLGIYVACISCTVVFETNETIAVFDTKYP